MGPRRAAVGAARGLGCSLACFKPDASIGSPRSLGTTETSLMLHDNVNNMERARDHVAPDRDWLVAIGLLSYPLVIAGFVLAVAFAPQ
jgi:hypothetical protein